MEIKEYIKKWSIKLSLKEEQIQKEFDNLLADEKEIHSTLTEDEQQQRAIKRLALQYKKQLNSPAVGFEGIIIAVSDCIDMVARKRREAVELFRADPMLAIEQGVVNETGEPLETQQTWSTGKTNPRYGKPLPEHNYFRKIIGVTTKSIDSDEKPIFFTMTVNGDLAADDSVPIFKPVRFMAIDRSDTAVEFKLNASSFTKFVEDESVKLPPIKDILKTYCDGFTVAIDEIEKYHNKVKEDYDRLVVIEGDVSSLSSQATSVGNRVMNIEDAAKSLEDLDAKGITCWVPERIKTDFAEGSKVIVVGRTNQGFKKNEAGEKTKELGDVTLNVYGVYALPEFKVPVPEDIQPITENNNPEVN